MRSTLIYAALPGSAFGEDDASGQFRLRMASSYLYFSSDVERYSKGYELLSLSAKESSIQLPLLDHAVKALQKAIAKLKIYTIMKLEFLFLGS